MKKLSYLLIIILTLSSISTGYAKELTEDKIKQRKAQPTAQQAKQARKAQQTNAFVFDDIGGFNEGLASVKKNGKYGFIDKTGRLVTGLEYDDAEHFSEGLARVQKNGKYGFIDKTGRVVIDFQYDYADSFNEGLARAQKNGKWGFIDKTGKPLAISQ